MMEEFNFLQIYHLKDVFFSAEILISCSVLQLTFYVISVSYTRRNGFVILNQQVYYIGFLILFLSSLLIFNEDFLFQNLINVNDYLSFFSKLVICITSLFFILVIKLSPRDELMKHNFEYVTLILIGVLGSLLLCSSNDLLTAYLSMELQSVAFYLMAAFKKNSNYSIESGLKYFIIGSFASALFLFGSSFIYGYTGSLNFNDYNLFLNLTQTNSSDFSALSLSDYFLNFYLVKFFVLEPYHIQVMTAFIDFKSFLFYNKLNQTDMCYPDWFLFENNLSYKELTSVDKNAIMFCEKFLPYYNYSSVSFDAYFPLELILEDCFFEFPILHYIMDVYFLNSVDMLYYHDINSFLTRFSFLSIPQFNFDIGIDTSTLICSKIVLELCGFGESLFDSVVVIDNSYFDTQLVYIGFSIVCLSLLIKLAAAPFHFWSLDVYEGSPNASTFFFAVVPKIGLFVLLLRICYSGFYEFLTEWRFYFLILSSISIFVGSLGGLEQRKLKSLLAYSSISHTGYLLLAFSTNATEGVQMMIYYIVIFMISGLCFWSIYMFLRLKTKKNYYNKQNKELGDLVLLSQSNPMLAIALTITLFSIAGIPPLVGFLAKFSIFLSVLIVSVYIIALISILLSVISTFYYIRVIKIIYFENILVGKLYHSISTNKSLIISLLFVSLILLCMYPIVLYIMSYKAILLL